MIPVLLPSSCREEKNSERIWIPNDADVINIIRLKCRIKK